MLIELVIDKMVLCLEWKRNRATGSKRKFTNHFVNYSFHGYQPPGRWGWGWGGGLSKYYTPTVMSQVIHLDNLSHLGEICIILGHLDLHHNSPVRLSLPSRHDMYVIGLF